MCLKSSSQSDPQYLAPSIFNEITFDARNEFASVFELLLSARVLGDQADSDHSTIFTNRLTSELQALLLTHSELLYSLSRGKKYSRHVIGTDGDWIGYICRWEKQVSSAVHGHPSFAYYQVIEGEFLMDIYENLGNKQVELERSLLLQSGDVIWNQGPAGCYDNLIHRVSTRESIGFTLHLFSEDPGRGQHFLH